jgi:hypothetical protein
MKLKKNYVCGEQRTISTLCLTQKTKRVLKEYKAYHQCGIKFSGNDIFKKGKVTIKNLLKSWGIEEINRIYEMITTRELQDYVDN